jgi:hypothetical protein
MPDRACPDLIKHVNQFVWDCHRGTCLITVDEENKTTRVTVDAGPHRTIAIGQSPGVDGLRT